MNAIFIILMTLIPLTSFSDVSFSIEYEASLDHLQKILDNLTTAQNRDEEMQNYPVFLPTLYQGIKLPVMLVCKANMPSFDGKGCTVSMTSPKPAGLGDMKVTISKGIEKSVIESVIAAAKIKLQVTDPSNTEEHLHFGNPFNKDSEDTTHFYCRPSNEVSAKKWLCYLSVNEIKS